MIKLFQFLEKNMKITRSSTVITAMHHGFLSLFISLLFLVSLTVVGAQPGSPPNNNQVNYARFSPSVAIIIVVLISALFFMGFFSIYIRHCSDTSGAAGSIRRALSMRNRRTAAARGLEPSVIETFPTFSYSEVKDHQIGKGALECAVCLNEFEEDETLRLMPKCDHVFHTECIDAWLESHVTCPVCRANLSPGEEPVQDPGSMNNNSEINENVERTNSSRNEEIVIQVDDNHERESGKNRNSRSVSIGRSKVFTFGEFRSHSTGHSFVQPAENLDRFTLRLPAQVRKEVLDRAKLNRSGSCAIRLPGEGSSRRGYRTGRSGSRIERTDREVKSDRWVFFTRGLSMKSPRVVAETGESSGVKGSGRNALVKLSSFNCLEPKAADETHPFDDGPVRPAPPV